MSNHPIGELLVTIATGHDTIAVYCLVLTELLKHGVPLGLVSGVPDRPRQSQWSRAAGSVLDPSCGGSFVGL
jgi:hypothetical protein